LGGGEGLALERGVEVAVGVAVAFGGGVQDGVARIAEKAKEVVYGTAAARVVKTKSNGFRVAIYYHNGWRADKLAEFKVEMLSMNADKKTGMLFSNAV
jgi:hypothetical protein